MELQLSKDLFFPVFGFSFLALAISWLLFARRSMARIEREMARDGVPRPATWDGVGARALWYACAIGLRYGHWLNQKNDPFFDSVSVMKYATPGDRKLAKALVVSATVYAMVCLAGLWVLDSA